MQQMLLAGGRAASGSPALCQSHLTVASLDLKSNLELQFLPLGDWIRNPPADLEP